MGGMGGMGGGMGGMGAVEWAAAEWVAAWVRRHGRRGMGDGGKQK